MEASNTAQYWIDQVKQSPYRALSAGIGIGSLQTPSEKSPAHLQAQKVPELPPLYNTPSETSLPEIGIEQNQSAQLKNTQKPFFQSFFSSMSSFFGTIGQSIVGLFSAIASLIIPTKRTQTKAKQATTTTSKTKQIYFLWAALIDFATVSIVLLSLMIATGFLTGTFDKGFKLSLIGTDPVFKWVFKLKTHEIASTMLGLYMLYWIIFRIVVGQTLGQVIMTEGDSLDT